MFSGRYREIDALLDSLLEVPPDERAAFLDRSCGADANLRRTLEGLLAAYDSQDGFLDLPALALLAAGRDAALSRADLSGSIIAGYQVLQPLGAGAIAEVWLARDTRLERSVALKILRTESVRDPNQLLRFGQEARAASKLSHPNIVTIYEIGASGEVHFIAQEFVDGVTLRKRLNAAPLPLDSILDIALQVVAALSAAHKAGIVHRDIKPENLMIRNDGLVKVLDFGIARVAAEDSNRANDWLHAPGNLTIPGLILGTVKYMSPEQARGLTLDRRSDIFSFGSVLYEMATGRAPFSGPTNADTLAAVLADEPPPISTTRPDLPADLMRLIGRCLHKDRDGRFSSAEELAAELKTLALRKDAEPSSSASRRNPSRPTNTAFPLLLARPLPAKSLFALLGLLMLAAALFTWRWRLAHRAADVLPFDSPEMNRLTLPGPVTDAAIAPDAKTVVYLLHEAAGPSLWIRQLTPISDKRIAILKPGVYQDLIYSPDSAFVYYIETANLAGTLYRVRPNGGSPEQVLSNVTGRISFAPDGRRLAFIRLDMTRWQESLIVANADGSGERTVTTRHRPYYYSRSGVAWSSDGRSVFCLAGTEPFYTANAYRLVRVLLASGRETPQVGRSWAQVGSLIGSLDGRLLLVAGSEHSDQELQLWRVSLPQGNVTRITRDLSNYAKLSLSANGQTLLAVRREKTADLWTMSAGNTERATQISNGDVLRLNSAVWTRDGRIVFSALSGQYLNLWKMDASGQNLTQLTRAAADQAEVAATADGRYILFHAGGKIWRVNPDGSGPRQLTTGNLDVHPVASRDSRWVVYASLQNWSPGIGGRPMVWRVPIDGGAAIQITKDSNSFPAISPDGKLVACAYYVYDQPQSTPAIAIYPFAGGPALKVFKRPPGSDEEVDWSPGGRSLEYIVSRDGVSNIWRQPLSGGEPAPITHFAADRLFFFSRSPEGKRLLLSRGNERTELVLITQAH